MQKQSLKKPYQAKEPLLHRRVVTLLNQVKAASLHSITIGNNGPKQAIQLVNAV